MTGIRTALDHLVCIMREAAGIEVMPRFRDTSFTVRSKGDVDDLVTEADECAERRMTARLKALFPDALVVGEEATAADPGAFEALPKAELAFILDPVDGTVNFASGVPLFAMIGAIAVRGRTVAGVILDPVRDDVMTAVAGEGAWRHGSDGAAAPLRVREAPAVRESRGAGFWLDMEAADRAKILSRVALLPSFAVLRCSGHEYRLMASGGCDYVLFATPRLKPWDHAAGLLLCREAGGYAATLDGEEWQGLEPATSILIASSRERWDGLRAFLFPER